MPLPWHHNGNAPAFREGLSNTMRLFQSLGFALLALFGTHHARACEYNVRDVGFVELTTDPYQLYGYIDAGVPEEAAATFARLAYTALIDTNLEVKMVDLSNSKDEAALEQIENLGITTFPALALVSPEGRGYAVDLPAPGADFEEGVREALERLVMSPLRTRILDVVTSRYGVVVVVEGSDPGSNLKASDAAEDAVTKIHARMKMLPKPISEPPVKLVISPEQARMEPLLMWALDLAPYAEETPPEDAAVVVLYGRARRMGPNLTGRELTEEFITRFLSVIGADCECGLDRSWMQGTMLPIRWDRTVQKQVASKLGFDPEDPMTKTEISITISKGARTGSGTKLGAPESDFSFGYQEISAAAALEATQSEGGEDTELVASSVTETVAAMAPALEAPVEPTDASVEELEHEAPATSRRDPGPLWVVIPILAIVAILGSGIILWRGRNRA